MMLTNLPELVTTKACFQTTNRCSLKDVIIENRRQEHIPAFKLIYSWIALQNWLKAIDNCHCALGPVKTQEFFEDNLYLYKLKFLALTILCKRSASLAVNTIERPICLLWQMRFVLLSEIKSNALVCLHFEVRRKYQKLTKVPTIRFHFCKMPIASYAQKGIINLSEKYLILNFITWCQYNCQNNNTTKRKAFEPAE